MNKYVGGITLPVKFDATIMIYILLVALLGISAVIFKNKRGKILGIIGRFIIGAAFIYIFNLAAKLINTSIPLNPITALIIGLLEIPGLALVLILRYIIYP